MLPVVQVLKWNACLFQDWLYAAEAFHFAQYVVKGKSRLIEILHLPEEAILLTTPEWQALQQAVAASMITGEYNVVTLHELEVHKGISKQVFSVCCQWFISQYVYWQIPLWLDQYIGNDKYSIKSEGLIFYYTWTIRSIPTANRLLAYT
mgnify:CR=1 FL=1